MSSLYNLFVTFFNLGFLIGKLLRYINDEMTDNVITLFSVTFYFSSQIINRIVIANHSNRPLFSSALRFLAAAAPSVYSSLSQEEIIPSLMEMMKREGEEGSYGTILLSHTTTDSEASNIAVK